MTSTETAPRSETAAAQTVRSFFEAYQRHDVDAMADMCTDNADFLYVPYEVWGKQRVLRGDGKVKTIGKVLWTGLINSFPDLYNEVHSIDANAVGDVIVTCDIGGTQQIAWGFAEPDGHAYREPHLFVFHVEENGLIDRIRAYWNDAGINRQLGHLEVD
ncbi:MAG TPA: nuclear transport factor 2 family protein [Streptosporangiaceae bacterium]|jgi:ketosteroid isomerase-like protein